MRKVIAFVLACICVFSLCACGGEEEKVETYEATQEEIDQLLKAYEGRQLFFGEGHEHTNNGDGRNSLSEWVAGMEQLDMDFATILDHNRSSHMFTEEWDDACFIGGSEIGSTILDVPIAQKEMHYSLVFADSEGINSIFKLNARYEFNPETNTAVPVNYSVAELKALIQRVKDAGGLFVQNHPMGNEGYLHSDNPMDNWFADWTGIDVMCGYTGHSVGNMETKESYELWTAILANGGKVWATAITDGHGLPTTNALTAVYAKEKTPQSILDNMKVGDFNPGYCGIRMIIGETKQGSQGAFAGQKVIFSVGEFHSSILEKYNEFQVVLMDDKGEVFRADIDHTKENYFAYDCADAARFYRVEVQNVNGDVVAVGNPIWKQ